MNFCMSPPQSHSIRFRVMGLFSAFSSRVNQRRLETRLLHLFVSMWSTT